MSYSAPNIVSLDIAKDCKYYIALDTETTGLFTKFKHQQNPFKYHKKVPRLVSIGIVVYYNKKIIYKYYQIIRVNFQIPEEATQIHKITNEMTIDKQPVEQVLRKVLKIFNHYKNCIIVGHNIKYDYDVVLTELYRNNMDNDMDKLQYYDTMLQINNRRCSLSHLYELCFSKEIKTPHNALEDAILCMECFVQLCLINHVKDKQCKACHIYYPKECRFILNKCFYC